MIYEPRQPKWPWRDFLTLEERDKLAEAWDAKMHSQALNRETSSIRNRAIQRAKYAVREPKE